jgi:L-ascorbate metabolism protein UlaG (beta-lactamase superfamily)
MEYASNPLLTTIKTDYPGNAKLNGRFLNYQKVIAPRLTDIIHWKLGHKPQLAAKRHDQFRLTVENHLELLDPQVSKLTWLGHASFLISLNGKNILLDPVFGNIPLIKRRGPIPLAAMNYQPIDYILISHAHYDHLDKRTLQALCHHNPQLSIYCGLGTSELLRSFGLNCTIIEAGWYQQFPLNLDQIEFYFLPALHWSNRSLTDRNRRLWGSFIVRNQHNSIYFMGDSGYSPHFKEIGSLFPQIDYALLGIGAYAPRKIMQSSHINPEEAYQAFKDLNARYLLPMHYATYDLTDEPYSEPLIKIRQVFKAESARLKVVNPGALLHLNETPKTY